MQFSKNSATRNFGIAFGALCFCLSLTFFMVSTHGDSGLVGVAEDAPVVLRHMATELMVELAVKLIVERR